MNRMYMESHANLMFKFIQVLSSMLLAGQGRQQLGVSGGCRRPPSAQAE